jgi:GTP cyclohydrolase II
LQLEKSIELIKKNNCGAVVYMSNHEGRGIGLYAKAIANKIQEYGYDTYEANNLLNFDDDERNFEEAVEVLKYFREGKEIDLLSNNPEKINHIKGGGIKINNIHPLVGFENSDNYKYLRSKMLHAKKVI